jgi:hypothetical protein
MKVETIAAPSITQPTGAKSIAQVSARDRAIQMLTAQQSQQAPVQNPTNVAPEEMSAIVPKQQDSGQSAKDESQVPVANEASKAPEEPISSQYAVLARKDKALRLRDQQLKQKEAALRAQEEALKAKPVAPSIDESKYISRDNLLKDPIRTLLDMGLTYDQLTEAAVNGPSQENMSLQNELRAMREELKALKGETESTKKSFEENQNLQRQQAEKQIKSDVSRLVQLDPSFEMIKATGSVGDVVELITKTFDEDGILLTVEDAAAQVEEYLAEEAIKLARLNKIQQKLQPKVAQQTLTSQTQQQQVKTLTSNMTNSRPLSARDRAILAAEGKLNK